MGLSLKFDFVFFLYFCSYTRFADLLFIIKIITGKEQLTSELIFSAEEKQMLKCAVCMKKKLYLEIHLQHIGDWEWRGGTAYSFLWDLFFKKKTVIITYKLHTRLVHVYINDGIETGKAACDLDRSGHEGRSLRLKAFTSRHFKMVVWLQSWLPEGFQYSALTI